MILPTPLVAQMVKHLSAMQETRVQSLGWEDPLEKEMATHSSTVAWKIAWKVGTGGLQSVGSQRVGDNWATSLSLSTYLAFCSLLEATSTLLRREILKKLVVSLMLLRHFKTSEEVYHDKWSTWKSYWLTAVKYSLSPCPGYWAVLRPLDSGFSSGCSVAVPPGEFCGWSPVATVCIDLVSTLPSHVHVDHFCYTNAHSSWALET